MWPAIKISLRLIVGVVLFLTIIFWPAGRLDWLAGWIYLGLATANALAEYIHLHRVNPELIKYRSKFGRGTKRWDKIWMVLFTPAYVSIFVVAGFDAVRFGWSAMSPWLMPIGASLFILGAFIFGWSMGVNPFFEKTVRIQTERDHRVVDTGPYALVRHPGYVGALLSTVATPMLLGSWWAFIPAVASVAALIVRTVLEDRTLRAELRGYGEYASRIRYRLIPGFF